MGYYKEYKESSVHWIGSIPNHWTIVRLKYLCSVSTGNKDTQNRVEEGEYPFYVRSPKVERINSYSYDGESVLTVGDGAGTGKVFHYVTGKFDYHQRVYKFSDFKGIMGKYFYWYMFVNFINVTEDQNSKSTVDSLRRPLIDSFLFTIPPLPEQEEIVRYLDTKTQEIDQLVSITQKKIDLLKERRTSVINEVVTKGLNPNVELKDSGVEWVGEIPSHWVMTRLRNLGEFFGGLSGKSGDDFKQDDNPKNRPYIPYTNILRNTYISKGHFDYVVMEEGEVQNRVQKYDMFFLMSSETHEDLGKSSILIEEVGELYLNSFCKGFRINRNTVFPLFLNYQLLGQVFKELVSVEGKGFTRINLRQDRLKDVPVLLPPISEQEEIVRYLDTKTQEIDQLVSIEEKRIETLKEYRQSLISEVVTGKVKVTSTEPIYQEG
jgi:type I restriction enzyme S subunit